MKEIKAYIRVERAAKVHAALSEAGISHMTLSHVLAVGAHSDRQKNTKINYKERIKL